MGSDNKHIHDWESDGLFGVIIGVSKCKECGKVAKVEDFPRRQDSEQR